MAVLSLATRTSRTYRSTAVNACLPTKLLQFEGISLSLDDSGTRVRRKGRLGWERRRSWARDARVKAHLDDSSMLFLAKIYKGSCYEWFRCLLDMHCRSWDDIFFDTVTVKSFISSKK
jgi:hypothetical protein